MIITPPVSSASLGNLSRDKPLRVRTWESSSASDAPIRWELVQRVKARIFLGRYTTEQKIEVAIDHLLDDLNTRT